MTPPPSAIERAFQLARSGAFPGIKELKIQLRAEGYTLAEIHNGLYGRSTALTLRQLCSQARAVAPNAGPELFPLAAPPDRA